jgi:acetyl-CoA C-acetyltransferase
MAKTVRSLARGVALVGAGMSKFGSFPEKNSRDLFTEAYLNMQDSIDLGFDPSLVDAIYIGNFSSELFEGQGHTAPLLADAAGLVPRPATRVENACASGSAAFRQGILEIASGLADVVLVGGVEKMTSLPTTEVTDALASAGDTLYEIPAGFTFPGFYAAMASAYMHAYGMLPEHLMNVAIKNHDNGALNPFAQFNVTIESWMESRKQSAQKKGKPVPTWADVGEFLHDNSANPMIAWPLRLFDCSPITDGAAAVLLVAEERARDFSRSPIRVAATAQASDSPMHDRQSLTSLPAARIAAKQAYEMAEIAPQDIRIAEVHDCFTIAEIIATEDLGFFSPGDGYKMAEDGVTARDGSQPVNTSGGLKAKGHPVGASGVAQIVEIWKQMRGEAGDRQVNGDIHWGLTHNVGATGNTCVVHIFENPAMG